MRKLIISLILITVISMTCYAPINPYREINLYHAHKELMKKEKRQERINLILKTIRNIESRNQYDIKGASGEYGAYQFMSCTWQNVCKKYLNEKLDITNPVNQDLIASYIIQELIDKGYTNAEIASYWNCGSKYYKNKIGVNSRGIQYNVPRHVNRFLITYKEYDNREKRKYYKNKTIINSFILEIIMKNRKALLEAYHNKTYKNINGGIIMNELKIEYKKETGKYPNNNYREFRRDISILEDNLDQLKQITEQHNTPLEINIERFINLFEEIGNELFSSPSKDYIEWLERKVESLQKTIQNLCLNQ